MTIVDAMRDPVLFGRFFGPSWSAWVVVLKSVFGIAMTEMELALFGQLSARQTIPSAALQLWILAGRRSGKTKITMLIGIWQAVFFRRPGGARWSADARTAASLTW